MAEPLGPLEQQEGWPILYMVEFDLFLGMIERELPTQYGTGDSALPVSLEIENLLIRRTFLSEMLQSTVNWVSKRS
jgi:hypothetical protein